MAGKEDILNVIKSYFNSLNGSVGRFVPILGTYDVISKIIDWGTRFYVKLESMVNLPPKWVLVEYPKQNLFITGVISCCRVSRYPSTAHKFVYLNTHITATPDLKLYLKSPMLDNVANMRLSMKEREQIAVVVEVK
jgi:hypothetical protein